VKKLNTISSGLDAQVSQVGFEFTPGPEGDIELHRLITGFDGEAGVFGGRALQDTGTGDWPPIPEYSKDLVSINERLSADGVRPVYLPSVDMPRAGARVGTKAKLDEPVRFVQQYVAVFTYKGIPMMSVPRESVTHAAATVLWFVLDDKSRVT